MRIGHTLPTVNNIPLMGAAPNVLKDVTPLLQKIRVLQAQDKFSPNVPGRRNIFLGRSINGAPPSLAGLGASLWSPATTTTDTSMVNWTAGDVTVPSNDQYAGQIVQALENDLSFKIQSGGFIMDPSACVAKIVNELQARCTTYPDLCVGVDLASVAAPMCSQYAGYLADEQQQYGTQGNVGVAPTAFATWNPDTGSYQPATASQLNNLQYAAAQGGQVIPGQTFTNPQGNYTPGGSGGNGTTGTAPKPASGGASNPYPSPINTTGGNQTMTGGDGSESGMPSWLLPTLVGIAAFAIVMPMLSKN